MSYDTKWKAISLRNLFNSFEVVGSVEIMVNLCHVMECHILEDSILCGCLLSVIFLFDKVSVTLSYIYF
jgi:hypothetical protein